MVNILIIDHTHICHHPLKGNNAGRRGVCFCAECQDMPEYNFRACADKAPFTIELTGGVSLYGGHRERGADG